MITDSGYALLAGTAGNWLKNSRWYLRFQRYVAGSVYIGLGRAGGGFRRQQENRLDYFWWLLHRRNRS